LRVNPDEGDALMAITAYLLYRDAGAAVDWLAKAFGLEKDEGITGADGPINHASMTFGRALLMLGSPGPDFEGPRALGHSTAKPAARSKKTKGRKRASRK
jgi:uncharacterized glyoxalase superfamily protein PhnB